MASIKDVARQAGVAISTVSKVLNGYTGVSEKTKERVNEVIEELNFTPNAMAAALSSRKSGRVALLLNLEEGRAAVDEIDLQYLAGAIHRARELKMDVVTLFFSMLEDKGLEEVVNYLKAQGIEGIILYGMERDALPPESRRLLRFGRMESGSAHNAVSGRTLLQGGLRAFSPGEMALLKDRLRELGEAVGKEAGCGYIVMHWPGERAEQNGHYPDGVVRDVDTFFSQILEKLTDAGVRKEQICLDPGFGFAKNAEQNVQLLKALDALRRDDVFYLTALSRKRFLGALTGVEKPEERDLATAAASVIAIQKGADMLRVHNVAQCVQAAKIADAVYRCESEE